MFVDEVRQKVEKLRAMDQELRLFAADHHRYEFNPPLAEIDLLGFEERNRISLPKDYRDFVLNVGNGGAGPYYGIYPLLPDNVHHGMSEEYPIDVSVPFPHSKDWNEGWERAYDWETGQSPDDSLDTEYFDSGHITGTLCICDYGCGNFFLLAVNGSEKGNIWVDGRLAYSGIFRGGFEDGERERAITFSEWYLNWLDRSLEKLSRADGGRDPIW
jgi:hypothetical protein